MTTAAFKMKIVLAQLIGGAIGIFVNILTIGHEVAGPFFVKWFTYTPIHAVFSIICGIIGIALMDFWWFRQLEN